MTIDMPSLIIGVVLGVVILFALAFIAKMSEEE